MLEVFVPQLESGDEVFIIGDGPTPAARRMVESVSCPRIIYDEMGPYWNWGNPQRNWAMDRAKGEFLVFLDDDDDPHPRGLQFIKQGAARNPDRVHMFRVHCPFGFLPYGGKVIPCHVSGQCIIPPNDKKKLGRWSGKYSADMDFITGTLAHYPPDSIMFHDEVICHVEVAGPGLLGHEIADCPPLLEERTP